MPPFRETKEGVLVTVFLQPRASRTEVVGVEGEAVRVRVQAPPVKGRANEALVELLAEVLGVPRRDVELVRGHTSRHKQVLVRGICLAEAENRLLGGTRKGS